LISIFLDTKLVDPGSNLIHVGEYDPKFFKTIEKIKYKLYTKKLLFYKNLLYDLMVTARV